MSLSYLDKNHTSQGKTTEDADFIKGRFLKFSPNKRVVQVVQFESDDLGLHRSINQKIRGLEEKGRYHDGESIL